MWGAGGVIARCICALSGNSGWRTGAKGGTPMVVAARSGFLCLPAANGVPGAWSISGSCRSACAVLVARKRFVGSGGGSGGTSPRMPLRSAHRRLKHACPFVQFVGVGAWGLENLRHSSWGTPVTGPGHVVVSWDPPRGRTGSAVEIFRHRASRGRAVPLEHEGDEGRLHICFEHFCWVVVGWPFLSKVQSFHCQCCAEVGMSLRSAV